MAENVVDWRALLEKERADLCEQLRELGVGEEEGLTYDANFADSSQVTAERGEVSALAASLQEALSDVEHALTKIDDSRFGACEGCEQAIDPARLEAMPAARLCIECASKR